jgi:hypothetical protein
MAAPPATRQQTLGATSRGGFHEVNSFRCRIRPPQGRSSLLVPCQTARAYPSDLRRHPECPEISHLSESFQHCLAGECPREAAEPLSAEVHESLQTFEVREPYRMDGVQSFREKRPFRRTIGRLCRSEIRSSNEKSVLLPGLFAREFTRRIRRLGQAGGGRGTGFEPSPRSLE